MNLTIIIPCLNEEKTVGICVKKALIFIQNKKIFGEVIVIDNGSSDNSVREAETSGARVVHEPQRGYGCAIKRGINESAGTSIIMGDADNTYNFLELIKFMELLENGADLIIGNRFRGKTYKNAMPLLHRWVGTPFLTFILKLLHNVNISDINCGLRAFKRKSIQKLELNSPGMEFASEMIIKASINNLLIKEIPINLYPANFERTSHLNPFKDGLRHLKLILTLYIENSLEKKTFESL